MNRTEEIVESKLAAYLDRRTPPRQIQNNPAAQDDEMASILRVLLRYRPGGNLDEWWRRVEDGLAQSCETYSWPLPKHFAKAAEGASKQARSDEPAAAWEVDPVKVMADRMNAGDPVGEGWFYGDKALLLENSGRVPAETMKAYRSAAYFRRVHRKRDGAEDRSAADAWEAAQKRLHQQAVARQSGTHTRSAPPVADIVKTFGAGRETPSRNDGRDTRADYMTPDEIADEDRRAAG